MRGEEGGRKREGKGGEKDLSPGGEKGDSDQNKGEGDAEPWFGGGTNRREKKICQSLKSQVHALSMAGEEKGE